MIPQSPQSHCLRSLVVSPQPQARLWILVESPTRSTSRIILRTLERLEQREDSDKIYILGQSFWWPERRDWITQVSKHAGLAWASDLPGQHAKISEELKDARLKLSSPEVHGEAKAIEQWDAKVLKVLRLWQSRRGCNIMTPKLCLQAYKEIARTTHTWKSLPAMWNRCYILTFKDHQMATVILSKCLKKWIKHLVSDFPRNTQFDNA